MCGIVGFFNVNNASNKVYLALELIKQRGVEAYGIATKDSCNITKTLSDLSNNFNNSNDIITDSSIDFSTDSCAFGHCLHSVVSFVPQPLIGKGKLIANCEIYNWEELNLKYSLDAKNDAEVLLKLLDKFGIDKTLSLIDGVYAFSYWLENKVYLIRDILGIKPLWFYYADGLCFASEKKALEKLDFIAPEELNPRKILIYNIKENKISFQNRDFFELNPLTTKNETEIIQKIKGFLINAITKRIPDKKFGLLFSGGVDSSTIALILKQLDLDFTCYVAVLDEPNLKQAEDLEWAQKAALEMDLKLKIRKVRLSEIENYLKIIVPLIEDSNVTKVGVALTFFVACEMAKEDEIKVIFSGLGSEEIFAGYDRHKKSSDINKECYSGLLKIYERDTYRDDVITMANNLELRLPFLDKALVDFALKIPADLKINEDNNKLVLRKLALEMGLSQEIASRKKRAAQYGSRFDSALEKLARKNNIKTKSEYLKKFYPSKNVRLAVLFSSGKDSTYALYTMLKQNYEITCLVTLKSKNQDSFMFHTPNINIAKLQAECMGYPILEFETQGEKEEELNDLKLALEEAKIKYKIEGVVTGALYSNYQRERIEKVADSLSLKIFSPLWHMNQEMEFRNIIDSGFKVLLSSIAAYGLDKTWLGKQITHQDISKLVELNRRFGVNVAGEGGEFESLVIDGPDFLFKKRIVIEEAEIISDNENTAKWIIKKARVEDKTL